MGVDHPGGPGEGPEPTDEPTPPSTGDKPPVATPGADGKTPRMDSLEAAGWKFESRQAAGPEQPGDQDGQPGDSTPTDPEGEAEPVTEDEPQLGTTEASSQAVDREADPQTGTAEAAGTNGQDPELRKADPGEPRAATQETPGAESPRERDGEAVDSTGDTDSELPSRPQDNGTGPGQDEAADKAEPAQPGRTPYTDNPASRDQPSRIASLIAAGWEFPDRTDDTQPLSDAGEQPPGEPGDKIAPLRDGDAGEEEHGPEAQPPATEAPPGTPDGGATAAGPPADSASRGGLRPESAETRPVTEEQQQSFDQSRQYLSGLTKRKQTDEVGIGFERDAQRYKPEAPLLKAGKHGVDWAEGTARAIRDGRPQGQFGSAADVKYATERGAELGPNKTGFFRLPEGHDCVEHLPDGKTRTPNSIFVKVYPNGKVHAYPLTR